MESGNARLHAMARATESLSEYLKMFEKGKETADYDKWALTAAREYRDICLKEMVEKEKKKNGIVNRAKTIEELII